MKLRLLSCFVYSSYSRHSILLTRNIVTLANLKHFQCNRFKLLQISNLNNFKLNLSPVICSSNVRFSSKLSPQQLHEKNRQTSMLITAVVVVVLGLLLFN